MEEKVPYRMEGRGSGTVENETGGTNHSVSVINRERVQIGGVVAVESFDDVEVNLETNMGMLTIRGEELQIKQLDLETGRFEVEGYVNGLQYAMPRQRSARQPRGRSFLERLLR